MDERWLERKFQCTLSFMPNMSKPVERYESAEGHERSCSVEALEADWKLTGESGVRKGLRVKLLNIVEHYSLRSVRRLNRSAHKEAIESVAQRCCFAEEEMVACPRPALS